MIYPGADTMVICVIYSYYGEEGSPEFMAPFLALNSNMLHWDASALLTFESMR